MRFAGDAAKRQLESRGISPNKVNALLARSRGGFGPLPRGGFNQLRTDPGMPPNQDKTAFR